MTSVHLRMSPMHSPLISATQRLWTRALSTARVRGLPGAGVHSMKNAAAKLAKATDDEQVEGPELTGTLHFMQLLWELHHNLQARSKRMESTHGVTGPQRLVLRLVARYPGMSAGELAALLRL